MAVLNIDKVLGKIRNRVDKVGLEVEGGWTRQLPPPDRMTHDGSVFDRGRAGQRQKVLPAGMPAEGFAGEAVSPPLEPSGFPRWLRRCHPMWVDDTCALHVHMSFKNVKYYEILCSSIDYNDTLLHYIKTWALAEEAAVPGTFPELHHLWSRLEGRNRFAMSKFWPERQIANLHKPLNRDAVRDDEAGHRYTVVNYCFGVHKTLEVRVLPMMRQADLSVRAVRRVIDITNACLVVMATKLKPVVEEVTLLPDVFYEEIDHEVI